MSNYPECPKCHSSQHVVDMFANTAVGDDGTFLCLDCDTSFALDVIEEIGGILPEDSHADDGIIIEDEKSTGSDIEPQPSPAPTDPAPDDDDDDLCVQADDAVPDCTKCEKVAECDLKTDPGRVVQLQTSVPAMPGVGSNLIMDGNTLFPLEGRMTEVLTEAVYRARVDTFKLAILHHCKLNPAKTLLTCASAFLYMRLMAVPRGFSPIDIIELTSEVLAALGEIEKEGIVLRETTPPGARIN